MEDEENQAEIFIKIRVGAEAFILGLRSYCPNKKQTPCLAKNKRISEEADGQ